MTSMTFVYLKDILEEFGDICIEIYRRGTK